MVLRMNVLCVPFRRLGLAALTAATLVACDPAATGPDSDAPGAGGKADAIGDNATCGEVAEVEALILEYWQSWQDGDFERFRRTLADDVVADLGFARVEGADEVTALSEAGNPFRDVKMVAADFHARGGTIIYTAVDEVTNTPVRISELIAVEDGQIAEVSGVFFGGPAPRVSSNLPFDADAFAPFDPSDPDGPQTQVLWGDPTATAFGMLIRTTSDLVATSHGHTQGYHAIVLQGVVRNAPDIDYAQDMRAGSYWVQAGGEDHITKCMSDEPCISLVMFDGPFDFVPPGK